MSFINDAGRRIKKFFGLSDNRQKVAPVVPQRQTESSPRMRRSSYTGRRRFHGYRTLPC